MALTPIFKYGLLALFAAAFILSFYVSIFKFKEVTIENNQEKTRYNFSRSIGLFVVGLFSLQIFYSVYTDKDIRDSFKELSDQLNNLTRNTSVVTVGKGI
jgi:hypothetical protein